VASRIQTTYTCKVGSLNSSANSIVSNRLKHLRGSCVFKFLSYIGFTFSMITKTGSIHLNLTGIKSIAEPYLINYELLYYKTGKLTYTSALNFDGYMQDLVIRPRPWRNWNDGPVWLLTDMPPVTRYFLRVRNNMGYSLFLLVFLACWRSYICKSCHSYTERIISN